MEYDESKDVVLWEEEAYADDYNSLIVSIHRYGDTGKPKVQISRKRYNKQEGDWTFAKLGRMTYVEFSSVAKYVKQGFLDVEAGVVKIPHDSNVPF